MNNTDILARSYLINGEGGNRIDLESATGGVFSPYLRAGLFSKHVLGSKPGIYEMGSSPCARSAARGGSKEEATWVMELYLMRVGALRETGAPVPSYLIRTDGYVGFRRNLKDAPRLRRYLADVLVPAASPKPTSEDALPDDRKAVGGRRGEVASA